MESKPKTPLTPQQKREWEKVVLELNTIFPAMTLQELAKVVRAADGSFDVALTLLMTSTDNNNTANASTSNSSPSSAPSVSEDSLTAQDKAEFERNAELVRLRAQYSRHVPGIISVIGEGVQDELVILKALETAKGDTQEAVLALLALPERAQQPSETASSRDALRRSATHIASTSSIKSSSGIEELPINFNLAHLDTPPTATSSGSTTNTITAPISMATISSAWSGVPKAPLPSPSTSVQSDGSDIASKASSATAASSSKDILDANSNSSEEGEFGEIQYDLEELTSDDEDQWLSDPRYEEVRDIVFGTDFITQMLQEEYDALLAQDLQNQLDRGVIPDVPVPVDDDPAVPKSHPEVYLYGGQIKPSKPAPVVPDPKMPCRRKWEPFRVPKKKQIPSGPKYVPPIVPNPSGADSRNGEQDQSEELDKELLAKFLESHPVIETTTSTRARRDDMPILAKRDESLTLASTIKQLKQLLAARLAAIDSELINKAPKKSSASHASAATQHSKSAVSSAADAIHQPSSSSISSPNHQETLNEHGNHGNTTLDTELAVTDAPALFDLSSHIDRIFAAVAPKTTEECLKIQYDEIRELLAVFTSERVQISESIPTVLAIALSEPSFEVSRAAGIVRSSDESKSQLTTMVSFRQPLNLQLVVALPPLYPNISPALSVRTITPRCPLSQESRDRLENHLREVMRSTLGSSTLAELICKAEQWLCNDIEVRKAALLDYHRGLNSATADQSAQDGLYAGLNRLFSFGDGYQVLHVNDLFQQRNRLLKRAIQIIINGRSVVYAPTPGNPDEPEEEYPVRIPGTDQIDEEATLQGLNLTIGAVRVILQHYNWNLARMSADYLSSLTRGTFETFLSEAGVAPVADRFAMQHHLPRALNEVLECPTCMDYLPFHAMFGLVCGHMLCKSCYSSYVDFQVANGTGLSNLTCPSPGCKYIVDQTSLAGLLPAVRWNQYVNLLVTQYVQANPALSWCPSPKSCEYLIQVGALDHHGDGISAALTGEIAEETLLAVETAAHPNQQSGVKPKNANPPMVIQCNCSYTFCSGCARVGAHFPASCTECSIWDKTHPNDAPLRDHDEDNKLSALFLQTYTRACPNCGAAISKNGGCVHMLCVACRHEFCWVCFGKWQNSHYTCSEGRPGGVVDPTEFITNTGRGFDSLLRRHRSIGLDSIVKLRQKLCTSMYRSDKLDAERKKKKNFVGANAINPQANLQKSLTIEDVPVFIEALEVLYVTHYVITNACKAGYALTSQGISTVTEKGNLSSLIHRGLEDIVFLIHAFQPDPIRKLHLYHVMAAVGPLKTSVKLIVGHLNDIRLRHLAFQAEQR